MLTQLAENLLIMEHSLTSMHMGAILWFVNTSKHGPTPPKNLDLGPKSP
jgi:hypothetical protein